MRNKLKSREHGIALLFCLIALLILTAITASLVMMSGTDTTVNANYRSEETAFFAAKAGIYEAIDRMQQSNANSIAAQIPRAVPSSAGGVLYIINSGSSLTVQPWTLTNTYVDDELCHEGYTITGMSSAPADVPCSSVPTGSTWYTNPPVTSNYPWSGGSAALPYEWVRINWKQNSSETYVNGTGSTAATASYSVNSTGTASTPVCWNNASEVLLTTPAGVTPAYQYCEQYQTCAATAPVITTPVYLITSLSVTPNGSRQMAQAEVALTPPTVNVPACGINDAYGFFAYGGTCASPGLTVGGNASVDGYNSSLGTYAATHQASLGDVGTNGGAVAQGTSTNIGGNVYVPAVGAATPPAPGSCPGDDFSISGSPHYGALVQSNVMPIPTVNIPANASSTDVSSGTIVPGSFRNLSVGSHGAVTLTAPGTYNFDCITAGSFGTITTSPATGKVTINVSGTGCASSPISFGSHAELVNTSQVASNIQINVPLIGTPGSASISMTGGPQMYCILNAPYAAVSLNGGADFYGTIMAYTIDDHGGTNLHFDAADTTISGAAASTATANATGSYNTLAFRSVPY
jgi:Tfp pilus assembly protein PilX